MSKPEFVYTTYIKTTPEKLWHALTDKETNALYWFGAHQESDWKVGSPWKIAYPDGRVMDSGEILELVPMKRIVIKWRNEWSPELNAEGFSRCTMLIEESDGAVKWTVSLDMPSLSLRGESAPAIAFGAAIVGGDNGRVSAVLMQQGQMIWQQRISQATGATEIDRLSDVDTTPVVVNGVVYALAYNGNLTALDLRSGQIMWKRELGSVNDFVIDNGRIVAAGPRATVVEALRQGRVGRG